MKETVHQGESIRVTVPHRPDQYPVLFQCPGGNTYLLRRSNPAFVTVDKPPFINTPTDQRLRGTEIGDFILSSQPIQEAVFCQRSCARELPCNVRYDGRALVFTQNTAVVSPDAVVFSMLPEHHEKENFPAA